MFFMAEGKEKERKEEREQAVISHRQMQQSPLR